MTSTTSLSVRGKALLAAYDDNTALALKAALKAADVADFYFRCLIGGEFSIEAAEIRAEREASLLFMRKNALKAVGLLFSVSSKMKGLLGEPMFNQKYNFSVEMDNRDLMSLLYEVVEEVDQPEVRRALKAV